MSLLIDRLEPGRLSRVQTENLGEAAKGLTAVTRVFEITNVNALLERLAWTFKDEDGNWATDYSLFPNVAPPFADYWMEWAVPEQERCAPGPQRLGAHVSCCDEDGQPWRLRLLVFSAIGNRKPAFVGFRTLVVNRTGGVVGPESDLSISAEFLHELDAIIPRCPTTPAPVDPSRPDRTLEEWEAHMAELDNRMCSVWGGFFAGLVDATLLMAHSLIACKNVDFDDHARPAKVLRARAKRGKQPIVQFKTLAINASKGRRDESRRVAIGGGQVAMHLVRGHFKTFTADKPLLGQHVGTYWWSPAVRGNEENGVVVKDYSVAGTGT